MHILWCAEGNKPGSRCSDTKWKILIMVSLQEDNLNIIPCTILINIIKYCTCFLTDFQYKYNIYDIVRWKWLAVYGSRCTHTQLIGSWLFQLQDHWSWGNSLSLTLVATTKFLWNTNSKDKKLEGKVAKRNVFVVFWGYCFFVSCREGAYTWQ